MLAIFICLFITKLFPKKSPIFLRCMRKMIIHRCLTNPFGLENNTYLRSNPIIVVCNVCIYYYNLRQIFSFTRRTCNMFDGHATTYVVLCERCTTNPLLRSIKGGSPFVYPLHRKLIFRTLPSLKCHELLSLHFILYLLIVN